MKNFLLIMILITLSTVIQGCQSKTIKEAFGKKYSDKGYEIVYTDRINDNIIAFYKTPIKNGNEGIGIALFEGNREQGWKMVQSYSYYSSSKIIIEAERFKLDKQNKAYIHFGYIDSPDITKIEVTDKNGNRIEGKILNTDWKRIWYAVAEINELKVKAFSKDGEILAEVPYQDDTKKEN